MKLSAPLTAQTEDEMKWNEDTNTPPQNHGGTYVVNQACIPQLSLRIDCLRVAKMFLDAYKYWDWIVAFFFRYFVFLCLIFRFSTLSFSVFRFSTFPFSRYRFCVSSLLLFFFAARIRAHGAVPFYFNEADSSRDWKTKTRIEKAKKASHGACT